MYILICFHFHSVWYSNVAWRSNSTQCLLGFSQTFLSPLVGGPQYSNIIPGVPADEIAIPIDSFAQKRVPQIPFYGDEYSSLSDYELEQQREAYELNAALQRQAAVDETIKGLLEEWFATAVESGK